MASIEEALALALGHQLAGRLTEAETLYGRILDAVPGHADTLHLFGVLSAQTGRLEQGAELIRAAVARRPEVADYHANLGNLLVLLGRAPEAVDCYGEALRLKPDFPEVALSLARLLLDQGRLDDLARRFAEGRALASTLAPRLALARAFLARGNTQEAAEQYHAALLLDPADAEAAFERANHRLDLGRAAQAAPWYRRSLILRPGHAEAWFNLGIALRDGGWATEAAAAFTQAHASDPALTRADTERAELEQALGRLDIAASLLLRALANSPADGETLGRYGALRKAQGRPDVARTFLARSARLRPDLAAVRANLAILLQLSGRLDEAAGHYRHALAVDPALADVHTNLCLLATALGRSAEATQAGRRAATLDPANPQYRINLGNALQNGSASQPRGLREAANAYGTALALKPDDPAPYLNLGGTHQEQGHPERSIPLYAQALALDPDYAEAHFNLAQVLLQLGRLDEGWVEQEWRWKQKHFSSPARGFTQPQWSGEPLAGRTILLHAEQGFGDTLQFVRYAAAVAQRGGTVVLEVPRPLIRLFAGLPGVSRLVATGEPLPAFDLHCPLMSLPLAFATDLASIPSPLPYLTPDPADVARWGQRLAKAEGGLRVGLVWAGNPKHGNDRNRSIPAETLRPFLAVPGVRFFSLQTGDARRAMPQGLDDPMEGVRDFADTAAILANLDLVIAVDTAVVHLAGVLGVPAWLLLPFAPDWRWLLGRDDTPWYPTTRLFRQSAPGDWDTVTQSVADALRARSRGKN